MRTVADIDARQLRLRIVRADAAQQRVKIGLLAEKLRAAQTFLYDVASGIAGGGRRGPYKSEVLEACTLFFVSSKTSSLSVLAEIPPAAQPSLPGLNDLGLKSLHQSSDALEAMRAGDAARLSELYPDHGQRIRLLRSATALWPEEEGDYDIEFESAVSSISLRPESRRQVVVLAREEPIGVPEEQVCAITGRLYLIEVETGERQLGLIVDGRRLRCLYTPDFEILVRELIPSSLVEVEGRATVDAQGAVVQIEEIYDARAVSLAPLSLNRIQHDERRFLLKRPIEVIAGFRQGVWTLEHEPLGLLGYGRSRADAFDGFKMEFAACWDVIACEDDSNLTGDARDLKALMKSVVDKVESGW